MAFLNVAADAAAATAMHGIVVATVAVAVTVVVIPLLKASLRRLQNTSMDGSNSNQNIQTLSIDSCRSYRPMLCAHTTFSL